MPTSAVPIWLGVCDSTGKVHLDASRAFKGYLSTLKNAAIEIIVRKRPRNRSHNANRYWWGVVIPLIAEELGYQRHEHDAVHDAVVRHIAGLRPGSDPRLEIRVSTHDMSVEDFGLLIEHTVIWAAQQGIVIPDPEKVDVPEPRAQARAAEAA